MLTIPTYLKDHQAVIDAFGYWPSFHDAPVRDWRLSADSAFLELETWEMTSEVDDKGYFVLTKRHFIGFEFADFVTTDFRSFGSDNILFELGFSSAEDFKSTGSFSVELDSAMGSDRCGSFRARSGAVQFVRPVEEAQ